MNQEREALLELRQLEVKYRTSHGIVTAVDRVDLRLAHGETLALIGESGCGKTSLGKAVVQLVKPAAGSILLEGVDLVGASAKILRQHRRGIQMVFQDSLSALDPRQRAGVAVDLPLRLHGVRSQAERLERQRDLFEQVGLPIDLAERLPHQLSGGQRQRLNIARALATDPKLVVCDEPVSALDVTLQAQIVRLLKRLQQQLGVAYLFISHDLSVVEEIADRIAVMYLGKLVEVVPAARLWQDAVHPYTRLLLASVPAREPAQHKLVRIPVVEAQVPSLSGLPSGCRFQDRCPQAMAVCREIDPAMQVVGSDHTAGCHLISAPARAATRPVAHADIAEQENS